MHIYIKSDPEFIPTWLYVKQHNRTKLKYLGKTTAIDPFKYKGSGKRWLNHIRKHGNDVSTIWCHLFTDKENLINFALYFSKMNNIVESNEWANLIEENGLCGWIPKRSTSMKGKTFSNEARQNMSVGCKKSWTKERRLSITGKNHHRFNHITPEDVKDKIRYATSGSNNPCFGLYGERHPAYGYKRTAESKYCTALKQKGIAKPKLLCPTCNKFFGGLGNLNQHIRAKHS